MTTAHISVKAAIEGGLRTVRVPARQILALTSLSIPVVWLIWGFSWLTLLHFPIGVIVASIYAARARPKWRIWAYTNVADIHQLQRAAELAELLPVRSHDSLRGWMTLQQRRELTELLHRFDQDMGFVDDPDIPEETNIYERKLTSADDPKLVISNKGITVAGERTFNWNEIENERIANVGYQRMNPRLGYRVSAGSSKSFRFECGSKRFEFHMADLKISSWELDLLTYIYRGRSATEQPQSTFHIPPSGG